MTHARHILLTSVVGAAFLLVGQASAQDALGAGDALDANPGQLTGGRNLPAPRPDFRARNLIVTGDVAGGRGFRGSVGYSAEGDFSGFLGSDDLFEFRARAFPSSPQVIQFGAQQFQFGQDLGLMEFRREMALPRAGETGDGILIRDDRFVPDPMRRVDRLMPRMNDELRLDALSQAATAGRALDFAPEPRPLGVVRGPDGAPELVTLSALRGVMTGPLDQRLSVDGLSTWDQARVIDDVRAGRLTELVGAPFESRFEQLMQQTSVDRRLDPGRQFDPAGRDEIGEYGRLLERIVQRHAGADNVDLRVDRHMLSQLDDRFADLRTELLERERQRMAPPETPVVAAPELGEPGEFDPLRMTRTAPGEQRQDLTPQQPEERDPMEIGDIASLLRHGQRVEQLSGPARTRFNELMSLAEESLRRGDYFMAERRFTRALRFTPGHPLAMAGLAHAQIGAGLHSSASLILQRMLIQHPEMIDTRFGPEVMPDQARVRQVMRDLEGRLPEPRNRSSMGFLLAYLGHQLDEREAVESGLKAMRESAPDAALLPLLEAVWLAARDVEDSPLAPRRVPESAPQSPQDEPSTTPDK